MSTTREDHTTRFTKACTRQPVDRAPVWMMRQAGRYMPEYQALRARYSFLELCQTPQVAAQATLDAARYLDTDAAIIFSDITIPALGMGLDLEFSPGPKFTSPIREEADLGRLRDLDPARDVPYVMEAIEITRRELPAEVSLIGFVGAPLTLGAYMVEGYPGKNWVEFKKIMYGNPKLLHALLDRVALAVTRHATAQVEAGCDAIQLFDTNAGLLAPPELHAFAFAYAQKVIEALKPLGVPVIYFAKQIGAHLEAAASLGADVLALDWSITVTEARKRLGDGISLMGNLDPTVLFTTPQEVDRRVRQILDEAQGHPGFVFNLGHGILPETPPPNARQVVQSIRNYYAEKQ